MARSLRPSNATCSTDCSTCTPRSTIRGARCTDCARRIRATRRTLREHHTVAEMLALNAPREALVVMDAEDRVSPRLMAGRYLVTSAAFRRPTRRMAPSGVHLHKVVSEDGHDAKPRALEPRRCALSDGLPDRAGTYRVKAKNQRVGPVRRRRAAGPPPGRSIRGSPPPIYVANAARKSEPKPVPPQVPSRAQERDKLLPIPAHGRTAKHRTTAELIPGTSPSSRYRNRWASPRPGFRATRGATRKRPAPSARPCRRGLAHPAVFDPTAARPRLGGAPPSR